MPFEVSIVLTGASIVNTNVDIYSNPVSNINHGTFVQQVTKLCLTTNSPCTVSVPDGTVTVRLRDSGSYCYWDLPVCDSNICGNCSLTFSNVTNPNVGKLSVGNLVSSCDSTMDNYVVGWYGPNNSNLLSFKSGKGTLYSQEYTNAFPLIGNTSPPLPPGSYVGKILKIELNGTKFSYPSIAGSVYSPTLPNCSLTQTITSLSCSNTTSPDAYYNHVFTYVGNNPSGGAPDPLVTFFTLNNNQTNFAYSFDADDQFDTLTLTLIKADGTQYILENIRQGSTAGGFTLCPTATIRLYGNNSVYRRVLTFSPSLNITSNDSIKIQVQPNTAPLTNWEFKCTCPPTLTYEKNCYNLYKDQSYRIQLSSLTPLDNTCSYSLKLKVQGCNNLNTTGFDNSNYRNYIDGWTRQNASFTNGLSTDFVFTIAKSYRYYITDTELIQQTLCNATFSPYTVQKFNTLGNERLVYTFTNSANGTTLYNEINTIKTSLLTTWVDDNTNLNYYKYIKVAIPTSLALQNGCVQENYQISQYDVHCSTNLILSPNGLTLTITTPTITYSSAFVNLPPVGYCLYNNVETVVNTINSFATGTIFNLTSVVGIRNNTTFAGRSSSTFDNSPTIPKDLSEARGQIYGGDTRYATSTYPVITPGTLIPSLNTKTSNFNDFFVDDYSPTFCFSRYRQNLFRFNVIATNLTPFQFKIYAKAIRDYGFDVDNDTTNPWILIYDSSLPSPVVDSNYFV